MWFENFVLKTFRRLARIPVFSYILMILSTAIFYALSLVCRVSKCLFALAWSVQKELIDWTLQTGITPLTTVTSRNGKPLIVTSDAKFAKRVLNMKQSHASGRPVCETNKVIVEDQVDYRAEGECSGWYEAMKSSFINENTHQCVKTSGVVADRYIQKLMEHVAGQQRDWNLYKFLKYFSIDSMMYAIYGLDLRIIDDADRHLLKHIDDIGNPDSSWLSNKLRKYRDQRPRAAAAFDDIGLGVTERLKAKTESQPQRTERTFVENFSDRTDYSPHREDDQARSVSTLFVSAVAESTAFTLYVSLYLLARNPKQQATLRQEVTRNLGKRQKLEFEDMKNLKYVESVILETLRLFPLDTSLTRFADKTGSVCGIALEQGTPIEITLLEMNLNHENFPDPWTFKPERFCDPAIKRQQNLDALLSFESGPRAWIVKDFALDIMKNFLASFLLLFRPMKTSRTPILFYLPADKATSDHKNKFDRQPLYIGLSPLNREGLEK